MRVNVVCILQDGRTISARASNCREAAVQAVRLARDPFYNRPAHPVVKIFFGFDDPKLALEEHTLIELESGLMQGTIPS